MTKDGGAGFGAKIAMWIALATALLAVFGYVYSVGRSVAEINEKLDRNCRIIILGLADIQDDVQFLTLEHADPGIARKVRRLQFGQGIADSCG